ncbi:T9SS type A sorting domain-containing protein [Luteibaculum oceani]|uniref:T9SS type A sorting domain-containing protein n=2 Tax=Luteibaculum oceani TaxID=1294296 RepID=A0A5C6URW7_9FLAO|nr:T9SS type A sorting domain-containing protein [Luteibaculum oceani]
MTIAFQQVFGGTARVYYGTQDGGTDPNNYPFSQVAQRFTYSKGMLNQFVELSNLEAGSDYFFVVVDDNGVSERLYFKTTPENMDVPLSLVCGANMTGNRQLRQEAFSLIAKLKPDLVVLGGDFTGFSLPIEWEAWLDDWQLATSSDGRVYPIVPVLGDEDASTDLVDIFGLQSEDSYYYLPVGENQLALYLLNTNESSSEEQRLWMANSLSLNASSKFWKMAAYHRPFRVHTKGVSDNEEAKIRWAPLFNQFQFDLAYEGGGSLNKITQPMIPFEGNGSEDGFLKEPIKGVTYFGDGTIANSLDSANDTRHWTLDATMDNQLKWVLVERDRAIIRAVRVNNGSSVAERFGENKFETPEGAQIIPMDGAFQIEIPRIKEGETFVNVIHPNFGEYRNDKNIEISWEAGVKGGGELTRVRVFLNNTLKADLPGSTNALLLSDLNPGKHNLQIIVNSNQGQAVSLALPFYIELKESDPGIINGSFDAEESKVTGIVDVGGNDLALGSRDALLGSASTIVGLYFEGMDLSPQAKINEAYIQFSSSEDSESGPAQVLIYGISTSNTGPFQDLGFDLSSRERTSAFALWDVPEWNYPYLQNADQRSPDLSEILEENFTEINGLNAIGFLIEGSGNRNAMAFERDLRRAPKLVVKYTEPFTDIEEQRELLPLYFYPNPVDDHLWIENKEGKPLVLSLRDPSGREIAEYRVQAFEKLKLNTENLEEGVYSVVMEFEGLTQVQKFIKKSSGL